MTFRCFSTSYSDLSDDSIDILKTMDPKQFRVLIYHCFLMKKNTLQAQQWLEKFYGDSAPWKTTICPWYAEFKRGRTDNEDAERSGRPNQVVTLETIKKVHWFVFENRKLKFREITDILKISYGSIYAILHEHLSMRELFSQWVPRLLTVDQTRQRVVDSERCLELLRRNKPNFLRRYVTMDETWIDHYTAFEQWNRWETATNEEEKSALAPRQCAVSQVARYHNEIEWIDLRIASAPIIFTGSGPQRLLSVCRPQKMLQGKRFYSYEEVITETNTYFEAKDKSHYYKGIEMLEKSWTDIFGFEGDYVDE